MDPRLLEAVTRVAQALERLAPPPPARPDLSAGDAFVWQPAPPALTPVPRVSRVAIDLLQGIDRQKRILIDNTVRFARGHPANNAMLWGARGMGKSSLVKAAHAEANMGQRRLVRPVDAAGLQQVGIADLQPGDPRMRGGEFRRLAQPLRGLDVDEDADAPRHVALPLQLVEQGGGGGDGRRVLHHG